MWNPRASALKQIEKVLMKPVLDNPAALLKQCELRRFGQNGRVERDVRWLPAEHAVVGRELPQGDGEGWEIVSAPDPALPEIAVRLYESAAALARIA
jgi:hypothetical protein